MGERKISLLLVEDDKVDQMAFERFVKNMDLPYDYIIAGSVAEAQGILKLNEFDIIISDYMLGDGVSFELFDLFKDLPVVVTTGTGNEEVAVEAMKLGAYDYLIKDPEGNYLKTLPATVELALKRRQDEKKLQNYQESLDSMVEERTVELQAEIIERKKVEKELEKKTLDIGERIKELNCLYSISTLLENHDLSMEEIFQRVVNFIPPAWQYPEITCSRIVFDNNQYKAGSFKETIWKQSGKITVNGEQAGVIEVYYSEKKPDMDEGPFLKEEQELINAIAERIGRTIERKQAEDYNRRLKAS